MNKQIKKPEFRNIGLGDLAHYRFPLGSIVSILHRASGAFMFLLLPLILWLLDQSLLSENSFAIFQNAFSHDYVKLILLLLIWAYLHHFCAGIRHLFLDLDIGVSKLPSRKSAALVLAISPVLMVLIALKMFGVF
jgi:succinate dehydrogenase / fumarate reductase cytochrome b subunit